MEYGQLINIGRVELAPYSSYIVKAQKQNFAKNQNHQWKKWSTTISV